MWKLKCSSFSSQWDRHNPWQWVSWRVFRNPTLCCCHFEKRLWPEPSISSSILPSIHRGSGLGAGSERKTRLESGVLKPRSLTTTQPLCNRRFFCKSRMTIITTCLPPLQGCHRHPQRKCKPKSSVNYEGLYSKLRGPWWVHSNSP
jgi:hypothetical protein